MKTPHKKKLESNSSLIRLQRVLAMAGVDSRRHCEEYILTGRVTVDGHTVTELGSRVDPSTQIVKLDGERLKIERPVYYLLNKPKACLCTNNDPDGRMRAIDLLPKERQRLFTVGRLDENSTGLLLCTNDGELANRLAHPRFRVKKLYSVQVAGVPTREAVQQLKDGMYFADGRFKADDVRLVRTHGQSAFLEIELTEGQNREIRRLLARIGHKVLVLQRVALGPLRLGDIPEGSYRPLNEAEIRNLQDFSLGKSTGKPNSKSAKGARAGRKSGPGQKARSGARSTGSGDRDARQPARQGRGRPLTTGGKPARRERSSGRKKAKDR